MRKRFIDSDLGNAFTARGMLTKAKDNFREIRKRFLAVDERIARLEKENQRLGDRISILEKQLSIRTTESDDPQEA